MTAVQREHQGPWIILMCSEDAYFERKLSCSSEYDGYVILSASYYKGVLLGWGTKQQKHIRTESAYSSGSSC